MDRGFFIILSAQFLSALADNALFIAAIALLKEQSAPEWYFSMLLWCFTISYVILAPFAGSFADSMHKGRAMMVCNGIKLIGCIGMLIGVPPFLAYAVVGFGAASYSPAKYGIITEYLPHEKLVAANGWLEGTTVTAIILGTILGGTLSNPFILQNLSHVLPQSFSFTSSKFAIAAIILVYLAAACINLYIPKLNVMLKPIQFNVSKLVKEFADCVVRLWHDPQGQLSLGVTTLFWGAGATMRLVVINWAIIWLSFTLEQSTYLIAIVAVGIAVGSAVAGKMIPLSRSFQVLPAGILMGVLVLGMLFVKQVGLAISLMFLVGALSGFFVVPLNAILQHRGYLLMGAGHSIAVQNFNENLGILVMVGIHALLVKYLSIPIANQLSLNNAALDYFQALGSIPPMYTIIVSFSLFIIVSMGLITWRYHRGVKRLIEH